MANASGYANRCKRGTFHAAGPHRLGAVAAAFGDQTL